MKKLIAIFAVVMFFNLNYARATDWIILDVPGSSATYATDISGSNIVGYYGAYGCGSVHGFLYSGTNWTTIDVPGASSTRANGIDGTNIVGNYDANGNRHGFLYNGTTWTTIDVPGAGFTSAQSIDGDNIAGSACGGGFLYNTMEKSWTVFYTPGLLKTTAFGICGNNVVGWRCDTNGNQHSFLYNGTTWTALDAPGTYASAAFGVDGKKIVGSYMEANYHYHGFLYTIPTPTSVKISISGGTTIVLVSGNPGNHDIVASTDFVHWDKVATVAVDATTGEGTYSEPVAGSARYYRASD